MPPLIQEFLGALLRHGLSFVFSYLVAKGVITADQSALFLTGFVGLILTLGWSLWQKHGARVKLTTALASPAMSEHLLNLKIDAGNTAPVMADPTQKPKIGGA